MQITLTKSVSEQPVLGFYQNYQGLRSKLVNFTCITGNHAIDIITCKKIVNNKFVYV